MAMFVFLTPYNHHMPYFKVKGPIWNFLKHRRVHAYEYIVRIFDYDIRTPPCLKTPLNSISISKGKFENFAKIDA